MKNRIIKITFFALFLAVFAQFTNSAMAFNSGSAPQRFVAAAPASQLESVVGEIVGYVYRNGQKQPAQNVQPGEVILWELTLQNNSDKPISNIKYDADIPKGTLLVVNSESVAAEFSLDNRNFSRTPLVQDASGNAVAAPVSSFVAIRFTVSLNAGEAKTLTYQTTVK